MKSGGTSLMSTVASEPSVLVLGPHAAGSILAPDEFDAAEWLEGFRYELIHGVLVVSPAPSPQERVANDELGCLLRVYQRNHPKGSALDDTLPEHDVLVDDDRRRADRVIWAGLRRQPRVDELPTIVIEFVSAGKRSLVRDFEVKSREYLAMGVQEYWLFNRFDRTLTVFRSDGPPVVLDESQAYHPPLLPGFELPLRRLFELANRWDVG
jgi:Uma2 family endonuclease